MKKVLLVFFMAVSTLVLFAATSFAEGTGNLVIHFQKWDGDYSTVGMNSWGNEGVTMGLKNPDEVGWTTDDFGVKVEFNGLDAYEAGVTEGAIGVQVVGHNGDDSDPINWSVDWNKKLANVEIPREQVQDGKTTHVYLFEGGVSRETDEANFAYPIYADPDMGGMMVVYFDPSNAYEENLGVHSWGWAEGSNAAAWNDPLQIFEKVGRTSDGTFVYAGVLAYADPMGTPGAIVYYGQGDDSKKTGNLEPASSENGAYIETPKAAGELDVVYVLNKGDNNITLNNIWLNEPEAFALEAFTFRIVDFDAEEMTGTYAVDPNTLIVKISSLLENPYEAAVTETEQADAIAEIESWFTVREVTGEATFGSPLAIERVDFARSNETLDTFVVILDGDGLDNTKDYQLDFSDMLAENPHEANIMIDMDTNAPELVFFSPNAIVGVPEAERIIEVPWGEAFNQNLFPSYQVDDDRDGDLTQFVYVPSGDHSTLDTRTEGDYPITLRVVDNWGNVTEVTFTFRVVKD